MPEQLRESPAVAHVRKTVQEVQAHIDAALAGSPTLDRQLADVLIETMRGLREDLKRLPQSVARDEQIAALDRQIAVINGPRMRFKGVPPRN